MVVPIQSTVIRSASDPNWFLNALNVGTGVVDAISKMGYTGALKKQLELDNTLKQQQISAGDLAYSALGNDQPIPGFNVIQQPQPGMPGQQQAQQQAVQVPTPQQQVQSPQVKPAVPVPKQEQQFAMPRVSQQRTPRRSPELTQAEPGTMLLPQHNPATGEWVDPETGNVTGIIPPEPPREYKQFTEAQEVAKIGQAPLDKILVTQMPVFKDKLVASNVVRAIALNQIVKNNGVVSPEITAQLAMSEQELQDMYQMSMIESGIYKPADLKLVADYMEVRRAAPVVGQTGQMTAEEFDKKVQKVQSEISKLSPTQFAAFRKTTEEFGKDAQMSQLLGNFSTTKDNIDAMKSEGQATRDTQKWITEFTEGSANYRQNITTTEGARQFDANLGYQYTQLEKVLSQQNFQFYSQQALETELGEAQLKLNGVKVFADAMRDMGVASTQKMMAFGSVSGTLGNLHTQKAQLMSDLKFYKEGTQQYNETLAAIQKIDGNISISEQMLSNINAEMRPEIETAKLTEIRQAILSSTYLPSQNGGDRTMQDILYGHYASQAGGLGDPDIFRDFNAIVGFAKASANTGTKFASEGDFFAAFSKKYTELSGSNQPLTYSPGTVSAAYNIYGQVFEDQTAINNKNQTGKPTAQYAEPIGPPVPAADAADEQAITPTTVTGAPVTGTVLRPKYHFQPIQYTEIKTEGMRNEYGATVGSISFWKPQPIKIEDPKMKYLEPDVNAAMMFDSIRVNPKGYFSATDEGKNLLQLMVANAKAQGTEYGTDTIEKVNQKYEANAWKAIDYLLASGNIKKGLVPSSANISNFVATVPDEYRPYIDTFFKFVPLPSVKMWVDKQHNITIK